ncbi:MAG: hypothetical protein PVI77_09565, partial [Desulfobacterales bacterium]
AIKMAFPAKDSIRFKSFLFVSFVRFVVKIIAFFSYGFRYTILTDCTTRNLRNPLSALNFRRIPQVCFPGA